jgi:hypothetical protein
LNAKSPENLIIFDYSGTLSLEAPRFAQPESLMRAFAESGLSGLGVTTAEIFWEQIVNPTWIEGSTTPASYKSIMAKRVAALQLAPGASSEEIEAAASRFVESYLDHSRIDPRWRPLLARLNERAEIGVIIATDHYAEATGKILNNLGAWNILASKIGTATTLSQPYTCSFFVANSADIGSWKEEIRFWTILKAKLSAGKITRLLIIDDFGFNEEAGDRYGGDPAKIARRQEKTRKSLQEVFLAEVEIIPFFLSGEHEYHDDAFTLLIAETVRRIDRFLEQ